MLLAGLVEADEVGEVAAEPVEAVGSDHIDPAGLHGLDEPAERGAVHGGAAEAAVVVTLREANPALVLLTGDVQLARLSLGIE